MKRIKLYIDFLEKKSTNSLSINQIKDLSKQVLNNNPNIAIVYCHNECLTKIKKHKYLKFIHHNRIYCIHIIHSKIISKSTMSNKYNSFYFITKNYCRVMSISNSEYYRVFQIVSGGQTGADMGGLIAGRFLKMHTGGYAPANYMTEDGPNISLRTFGLSANEKCSYSSRTKMNIIKSDATIIFGNIKSPGSRATLRFCKYYKKPVFLISNISLTFKLKKKLMIWLVGNDINTLNIAGNRESKNAGISKKVFKFLIALFTNKFDEYMKITNKEYKDLYYDMVDNYGN